MTSSVALSVGVLLMSVGITELKADNLWGFVYIAVGSLLLGLYEAHRRDH